MLFASSSKTKFSFIKLPIYRSKQNSQNLSLRIVNSDPKVKIPFKNLTINSRKSYFSAFSVDVGDVHDLFLKSLRVQKLKCNFRNDFAPL